MSTNFLYAICNTDQIKSELTIKTKMYLLKIRCQNYFF